MCIWFVNLKDFVLSYKIFHNIWYKFWFNLKLCPLLVFIRRQQIYVAFANPCKWVRIGCKMAPKFHTQTIFACNNFRLLCPLLKYMV